MVSSTSIGQAHIPNLLVLVCLHRALMVKRNLIHNPADHCHLARKGVLRRREDQHEPVGASSQSDKRSPSDDEAASASASARLSARHVHEAYSVGRGSASMASISMISNKIACLTLKIRQHKFCGSGLRLLEDWKARIDIEIAAAGREHEAPERQLARLK